MSNGKKSLFVTYTTTIPHMLQTLEYERKKKKI
jgi:hypothetical protein